MPLVQPPTKNELYESWKAAMTRIGFSAWSEGSRIGAIGKVIAAYLADLWVSLAQVETQTNPLTARGIYLERLAQMFGLKRGTALPASTVGRGPSVKFTNNGATSITIPLGTRVWSGADATVAFFTTASLTLAGAAEGYVDVIAAGGGDFFNIGTNVLDYHNAGMGQVSVTNVRPIGGGTLAESDDSLRFRISNTLQARHSSTALSIQQELLKVPGVRDVLVQSGVRGNGTVDITIIPVDRYVSEDLMRSAELSLNDVVAAGVSWRLKAPVTRRVNVQVQLRLAGGTTVDSVRAQVEAAVRGYLDNRRVADGKGESDLVYNELISRIQDASPNIIDSVVTLNLDGAPVLQTNIVVQSGERLVSGSVSIS